MVGTECVCVQPPHELGGRFAGEEEGITYDNHKPAI